MRLCSDTAPTSDEVQTESELTKKLLLGWNDLMVKDGVVYRRKVKSALATLRFILQHLLQNKPQRRQRRFLPHRVSACTKTLPLSDNQN